MTLISVHGARILYFLYIYLRINGAAAAADCAPHSSPASPGIDPCSIQTDTMRATHLRGHRHLQMVLALKTRLHQGHSETEASAWAASEVRWALGTEDMTAASAGIHMAVRTGAVHIAGDMHSASRLGIASVAARKHERTRLGRAHSGPQMLQALLWILEQHQHQHRPWSGLHSDTGMLELESVDPAPKPMKRLLLHPQRSCELGVSRACLRASCYYGTTPAH